MFGRLAKVHPGAADTEGGVARDSRPGPRSHAWGSTSTANALEPPLTMQLVKLEPDIGVLTPVFAPQHYLYALWLPPDTRQVVLKPTSHGREVTFNHRAVDDPVPLPVGMPSYKIVVRVHALKGADSGADTTYAL